MTSHDQQVCVVIAARDAVGTIARAVRSALAQRQVGEVLVIDDASTDSTAIAANSVDDGTGRLRVLRLLENRGPAAARNIAIEQSRSPLIALLDADDFYLAGRFDHLQSTTGWDAIADNIVFISDSQTDLLEQSATIPSHEPGEALTFERFVLANISRRGSPRGELGFLKPVIRRAFLDEHGLRYDETLRLGEDFDLYARMLARGARFRLLRDCGYVAVERRDSLSARHRSEDLRALLAADDALLATGLAGKQKRALLLHRRHIAGKWHVRRFLDDKRANGLSRTLAGYMLRPRMLLDAAMGIGQDKLDARRLSRQSGKADAAPARRFLLPLADQT